jgi:hypothetical protein
MARRTQAPSGFAGLIGIVLLVGLAILIIKWALITAAILAVPFGVWWVYDHLAMPAEFHREEIDEAVAAG